jgi:hypothetical protein
MLDLYDDTEEDVYWKNADPEELWVYDKLILSRKLGYKCGPVGIDVSEPGWYIVRPIMNIVGLGLNARKVYLSKYTVDLDPGHFYCEWFEGRHLSIDYAYGKQVLCVEGFKKETTLIQWDKWAIMPDKIPLPSILKQFANKPKLNCEFIGGKLIEAHFRSNPDFTYNNSEFIPVWPNQSKIPPQGYKYIKCPEFNGRVGAFIK